MGGMQICTNCVLSRAAITKRSGQRANQFEMCGIFNGEGGGLSGLSGNL
jgi:hypothetical protein